MLSRAVALALLWWVIADGAADSWLIGVPVVASAALVSLVLIPPVPWSLAGAVCFVSFFLWQSLRGGTDVAWRALSPRLPIFPDLVDYRLHLPPGLPRVFMVNTVSLLPGTLSAELRGDRLRAHLLDARGDVRSELRAVERSVARVFGARLPQTGERSDDEAA